MNFPIHGRAHQSKMVIFGWRFLWKTGNYNIFFSVLYLLHDQIDAQYILMKKNNIGIENFWSSQC